MKSKIHEGRYNDMRANAAYPASPPMPDSPALPSAPPLSIPSPRPWAAVLAALGPGLPTDPRNETPKVFISVWLSSSSNPRR